MDLGQLRPRKGKGKFGNPAPTPKQIGAPKKTTPVPMEESNPSPVTPLTMDPSSPTRNPTSQNNNEISEIPMEMEETPVPHSFFSPKSQDTSSQKEYKEPPGHFSPHSYTFESVYTFGNKTFPKTNSNSTSDKSFHFPTSQSTTMSTTSTMNDIPALPEDFMDFPDFLVEHFSSALPPIYKLQALIFRNVHFGRI